MRVLEPQNGTRAADSSHGRRMRSRSKLLASAAACFVFAACGRGSRGLAGDYRLRQLVSAPAAVPADTAYDLWNTARPENEAGNAGNVLRIGWNAHEIILLRSIPRSPYGPAAGWSLIDVDHGHATSLTAVEAARRAALDHIVVYRADSAWARL